MSPPRRRGRPRPRRFGKSRGGEGRPLRFLDPRRRSLLQTAGFRNGAEVSNQRTSVCDSYDVNLRRRPRPQGGRDQRARPHVAACSDFPLHLVDANSSGCLALLDFSIDFEAPLSLLLGRRAWRTEPPRRPFAGRRTRRAWLNSLVDGGSTPSGSRSSRIKRNFKQSEPPRSAMPPSLLS